MFSKRRNEGLEQWVWAWYETKIGRFCHDVFNVVKYVGIIVLHSDGLGSLRAGEIGYSPGTAHGARSYGPVVLLVASRCNQQMKSMRASESKDLIEIFVGFAK